MENTCSYIMAFLSVLLRSPWVLQAANILEKDLITVIKDKDPLDTILVDAVLAQLDKTMIGPLHSRKSAVPQARDTVLRSVVSEKLRPFLSHLSARWGVKRYILEHAEVAVAEHEDGLLFVAVRLERCDICLSISAGFEKNDCLRLGRHHADCSHTSKQCMHHCH